MLYGLVMVRTSCCLTFCGSTERRPCTINLKIAFLAAKFSKQAMAEHEEIYAALEARRQEQRITIAIQKHLKNAEDRLDMFYNRQRTQARLG